MKKFLVLISLFLMAANSQAQSLDFGLKLGTNISKLTTDLPTLKDPGFYTGLHAGVYGRVQFAGWFLQPELQFSQRGGTFTDNLTGKTVDNSLRYIEMPVLVGKKFFKTLRINAGPNFQYLLSTNETVISGAGSLFSFNKDALNSVVMGVQAGVGVDVGKFSLDVRYDTNLSNLGNSGTLISNGLQINNSMRNSTWQISLGYRLY